MDQHSITHLIREAVKAGKDVEETVWNGLPQAVREKLGRTRLRQIMAIELESDQLELAIDGERFTADEVPPEVLIKRADQFRAQAAGLIRRAEDLEAAARRRREA